MLDWPSLRSPACEPWPRAHLTLIRQTHLESSTRTLPGLEFHSVAVILITITAVICKAQRTMVGSREHAPVLPAPTPLLISQAPQTEGPSFHSIPRCLWDWWTGVWPVGRPWLLAGHGQPMTFPYWLTSPSADSQQAERPDLHSRCLTLTVELAS